MPKKGASKQAYEPQSMPDIDFDKNSESSNFDMDISSSFEADHTTLFDIEMAGGDDRATAEYEAEEDPFGAIKTGIDKIAKGEEDEDAGAEFEFDFEFHG